MTSKLGESTSTAIKDWNSLTETATRKLPLQPSMVLWIPATESPAMVLFALPALKTGETAAGSIFVAA